MSYTVDSLTAAILLGWNTVGIPGYGDNLEKLARGIAIGIYDQLPPEPEP
jgi:hypothetical protein